MGLAGLASRRIMSLQPAPLLKIIVRHVRHYCLLYREVHVKIHFYLIVGLALVGFAASQECAGEDAKSELEGTWHLVYFERDGKELKVQGETQSMFTGDKFVVKRGDKVIAAGTFKLDPSKKPKTLDAAYTEGPDKGKTFKSIYQIDGDLLKFCRAGTPDEDRPTEFKTKPESGQLVSRYKKAER